jgi:hypothetical protein
MTRLAGVILRARRAIFTAHYGRNKQKIKHMCILAGLADIFPACRLLGLPIRQEKRATFNREWKLALQRHREIFGMLEVIQSYSLSSVSVTTKN